MAILFRRSNGIYYYVEFLNGRRVWRSTGSRRKDEARQFVRQLERDQEPKAPPVLTLAQFATQFIPHAKTNLAPSTVILYELAIKKFIELIGNRQLRSYAPLDIERFKTLRSQTVSAVKVNIDYKALRALFQTAVKWGFLESNPFTQVKQIKVPPQRPVFLTKAEFAHLIRSIPRPWFRDLVMFAVSTMMRLGEIVNLTWDSVDLNRRVIHVENRNGFRVKTTQPRIVPMNEWVHAYLSSRSEREGYVFRFADGRRLNVPAVSRRFKKYVRDAGLGEKIHFHTLRHTGASWLVQDGSSIYAVQRLLGHSNIQVTMTYSHLVTSELHDVINKIVVTTN